MVRLAVSGLVLVGSLGKSGTRSAGIVKSSDEFEFVYRVKLVEIEGEARLWVT
jgi:hypothetical protein